MEDSMLPISETIILKYPYYENDSFIFQMLEIKIGLLKFEKIFELSGISEFAKAKIEMFQKMDTSPDALKEFAASIPSCKNIPNTRELNRTNYRVALKNIHEEIYKMVYEMRQAGSRRCVLTFANTIDKYYESENFSNGDLSCLSQIIIHENSSAGTNVTIIYRANDMKHDFLIDFYTLLKYVLFCDLFLDNINLTWISNTCQFHGGLANNMDEIRKVFKGISEVYKERA